jgi:hypothetical protein
MEKREITLADIFLDILSESQNKGTKLMAERIKAAIKSPEILELLNFESVDNKRKCLRLGCI